jgi:hypothetical protein
MIWSMRRVFRYILILYMIVGIDDVFLLGEPVLDPEIEVERKGGK